MVRHLLSSHDNGQSMVIYPKGMNHVPSVVCYRPVTTVRAWKYIPKVWTMLRQLLSSCDNGQSMEIYPWGIIHGPSVVIV